MFRYAFANPWKRYARSPPVSATYGAVHLDTATFARLEMALAQMPGSLIPLVKMNVLAVGRDSQEGLSKFSKLAELFSAGMILIGRLTNATIYGRYLPV